MASNGASARGLRQVGYFDCPGGGQVVVDGRVAYIAHMKGPDGTTLVDVSDPKSPRRLAGHRGPAGNAFPQGARGQWPDARQPRGASRA